MLQEMWWLLTIRLGSRLLRFEKKTASNLVSLKLKSYSWYQLSNVFRGVD